MKAFRAPGFVEGTFGLECLIDELAAKLELDPLELRRRNYADSNDGKPYSSKNLMECYDARAEALGPARRGARALDRHVEARRRDGVADLVRRRRPAVVRVDARRLGRPRHRRHRDAGHRHRHAHGDGADRGRGARRPARPRRASCSATARAGRTRRSPPARRRRRRSGLPCARRRPTRSGRSSRSRRSATTSRSACSTSRTASSSRPTATSRAARGAARDPRERADPRQGRAAARTRPA